MIRFFFFSLFLAPLLTGAAVTSALSTDRFLLAREFSKRGLHAEALKELEGIQGAEGIAGDELAYCLGEEYRALGDDAKALAQSRIIVAKYPKSHYLPYAKLTVAVKTADAAERKQLLESLDNRAIPKAVRDAARYHLAASRAQSSNPTERRLALATYLDLASSTDHRVAEEALYFAGMISYTDKRYGEAVQLFARLMKLAPKGARTTEARPYAAWANHLTKRPAETLELARPLAETNEDAAYLVALSLRTLERRDEAIEAIDWALKRFPESRYGDVLWAYRLDLVSAKGDAKGVLAMLAVRGDPPPAVADRAFAAACDAAVRLNDYPRALEFARRGAALEKSPFAPRAAYLVGVFTAQLGQRDEACRIWTALLARTPDSPYAADALRSRALEEIRAKSYKAANRTFGELARRFPARADDVETLYWRGVAARGADDLPEAEKLFDAAAAARPTPEFAREIELERAYLLQKRGDRKGAVTAMAKLLGTKAVQRLPDAELAWLAEGALAEGLFEASLSAADVLEKRTDDKAWRQIAGELSGEANEKLGRADAAAAAYRRALAVDVRTDHGARAALNLGTYESAIGQYELAAEHLTEAVKRSQTPALASVRLRAYWLLAKNEDARGAKQQALGYYMLAGTLFDDLEIVLPALTRAAEILREEGKVKEADDLLADLKKRHEH